ncbi:MAG: hypothetical protein BWY06_03153 [Candidatus Latescibacteria bacterium ADurb.Bin168]|jgi:hypothetical protein|nr:MAG: hypothetical protein BWY06_03153 [Candidatus Latescibacteria bacterium ADurb.Bin168]
MIDSMGVSEKVRRSGRVVAVQPRKRFMRSFHEKVSKLQTKWSAPLRLDRCG